LQVNEQLVPLHEGVAFAGVVHEAQTPLHKSVLAGHWHALLTHWPLVGHGLPHPPQFRVSLVKLTHAPLHGL
jgi:hypothetical protein